jgi:transglutaminase-like putative cysteine protease
MRDSPLGLSRPGIVAHGLVLWCAWATSVIGAQERFDGPHFVEVTPLKRTRMEITQWTTAPNLTVRVWGVMLAIPPETDGQTDIRAAIRTRGPGESIVTVLRETSALQQPVFVVHVSIEHPRRGSQLEVKASYDLTPRKRRLTSGAPPMPIEPLTPKERAAYTAETPEYDFRSATVEKWLREQNLSRRAGETDLTLGYRVYRSTAMGLQYTSHTGAETASQVCSRGSGACGGLSTVFVAVMRANGVPARAIYGRYLKNSTPFTTLDETIHVRAEFFAEGVGWIPVDVAAATAPDRNPDDFFGQDAGNLMVMHFDLVAWGNDRQALQSAWFGFGHNLEGTWDGETRNRSIRLTDPDLYLNRPR